MTNQFPQTYLDFGEEKKPSFLSRFIFAIVGLGILTVIGVVSYSASTNYAQKLHEVRPAKSTVLDPIPQPELVSQDGLELMVAPSATNSLEETALPPVKSPFENSQATPHPTPAQRAPKVETHVSPPSDTTLNNNLLEIPSADAIPSDDAAHESSAAVTLQPESVPNHGRANHASTSAAAVSESPVPVPESQTDAPISNP